MTSKIDEIKKFIKKSCLKSKVPFLWESHLKIVEKNALWLLESFPEAEKETVMLGVYLHDTQHIFFPKNETEHEEIGSQEAERILRKFQYDEVIIKKVKEAIISHSCGEVIPKTLEAKILATADGMSHFTTDFYFLIWKEYSFDDLEEFKEWALKKIEHDYNKKLFFDSAKKIIEPKYKIFKNFFLCN
ncbi:MAG: HD domain-containing protein [Alphaproteobacteria bacterium]